MAAVVEGPRAIETWRAMMGPTDPVKAPSGTIRGDFGLIVTENLVHGSDSPASAAREVALFFPHLPPSPAPRRPARGFAACEPITSGCAPRGHGSHTCPRGAEPPERDQPAANLGANADGRSLVLAEVVGHRVAWRGCSAGRVVASVDRKVCSTHGLQHVVPRPGHGRRPRHRQHAGLRARSWHRARTSRPSWPSTPTPAASWPSASRPSG